MNTADRNDSTTSPCVSICVLDDNDICKGCFRTAKEITYWGTYDDHTKIEVNRQALKRAEQLGLQL